MGKPSWRALLCWLGRHDDASRCDNRDCWLECLRCGRRVGRVSNERWSGRVDPKWGDIHGGDYPGLDWSGASRQERTRQAGADDGDQSEEPRQRAPMGGAS